VGKAFLFREGGGKWGAKGGKRNANSSRPRRRSTLGPGRGKVLKETEFRVCEREAKKVEGEEGKREAFTTYALAYSAGTGWNTISQGEGEDS